MPLLNSVAHYAVKPLPKVFSPTAHALSDYLTAGSFFLMAGLFWRRNKRAAIGALICGGAELAVSLLTDYPGGAKKVVSFRSHGKLDAGLAAMAATMPDFLHFDHTGERTFFLAQGGVMTAIAGLTDFDRPVGQLTPRRLRRAA